MKEIVPMADIAALINTCNAHAQDAGRLPVADVLRQAGHALSRLATPPLPQDIARLIKWCEVNRDYETRLATTVSGAGEGAEIYGNIAAALRALALENERLKATDWSDIGAVSILKERIRELEERIAEQGREPAV